MIWKIKKILFKLLEVTVILLMLVLVLDVIWQVFGRLASGIPKHIVNISPSRWTDELAVMLLIWVSLLGASVALMRNMHLGVDYFVSKLPENYRLFADIFVYVSISLFACFCMIYGGAIFVLGNIRQMSTALNIPVSLVYLPVPISGLFFLIISVESVTERILAYEKLSTSPLRERD